MLVSVLMLVLVSVLMLVFITYRQTSNELGNIDLLKIVEKKTRLHNLQHISVLCEFQYLLL